MDPQLFDLCKKTYNQIIKDNIITEEEWGFLMDLHRLIFKVNETNRNKIKTDIEQIVTTKIKYRK